MFIVLIAYVKPISQVDALLEAHLKFLNEQYDAGYFLGWGRRVPRTGGVNLAKGLSREALEDVVKKDPFIVNKVADYEIVEFVASKAAPSCLGLIE